MHNAILFGCICSRSQNEPVSTEGSQSVCSICIDPYRESFPLNAYCEDVYEVATWSYWADIQMNNSERRRGREGQGCLF